MDISRNWLTQYVAVDCDIPTLCDKLTMAGIEVEAVESAGTVPAGVVVGRILERKPHPDSDHTNGIEELLKEGQITFGELILPDIEEAKKEEAFADLLAAAGECPKNPPDIRYIKAGDSFTSGKMTALCLHPPKGFSGEDANVYSQCFYVKWEDGPLSLLLTGDTEKEGEALLLEQLKSRGIEKVAILKAAHHGSKNATGKELLSSLSPQLAVISCGKENSYGHPHEEVLRRLEEEKVQILQTPHTGAVTVTCKRGKILILLQNR